MSYPEPLQNFLKAQLFWELELRDPSADEDDMSEATNKLRIAEEEFIRWLRESEGMECSWFKHFSNKEIKMEIIQVEESVMKQCQHKNTESHRTYSWCKDCGALYNIQCVPPKGWQLSSNFKGDPTYDALKTEIKELKNYIKEIELDARGLRERIMEMLAQRTCDVLSRTEK